MKLSARLDGARAVVIGVLGGAGAMALIFGVVALLAWLAVSMGLIDPIAGPRPRIAAFVGGGAAAGLLPGLLGRRIRGPVGGALLGAATSILACGTLRVLDPAAEPAHDGASRLAQLLMPGIPGLAAPLIWAPLRAAARRNVGRSVAEIAGRVAALVLAVLFALMAAPFVLYAGMGLVVGLGRLSASVVLAGLGFGAAALALLGGSVTCLWLAGVPRRTGPLAGFEPTPHSPP